MRRPGDAFFDKNNFPQMAMYLTERMVHLETQRRLRLQEQNKATIKNRVAREQEKFIEFLDRGIDPALIKEQEEFLAKTIGMGPTPAKPLQRIEVKRDKAGNIIDSKLVTTSTASAFLSDKERALLAQQRQLEALHKRIISRGFIQTEEQRRKFLRDLQQYVFVISKSFMVHNIETSKLLLKVLAAAKAYTDAASYAMLEKHMKEALRETSRYQIYIEAMRMLQQRRVSLFINDIGLLEANRDMAAILRTVSFEVGKKIESLIYVCMKEAFYEAYMGLSTDAFPLAYRTLINQVIDMAQKNHAVKLTGGLATSGFAKMSNWQILADFEEIFGNRADFNRGFHFGALIKGGVELPTRSSFSSPGKVGLPYRGQILRNPLGIRYAFWRAVWRGTRYNPDQWYSPTFSATRKEHYARSIKRIESLKRRRQALEAKIEDQKNQQVKAMIHATSGRPSRWQRDQLRSIVDDSILDIQDLSDRIAYIEKGLAYSTKHKFSQPRKILNARKLKANTIGARVNYWRSINKAPVWLLLEFGQLAYEPRIPPRGVYYRFLTKLQKRVKELIRAAQNEKASQYYGYTVTPTGGRVVSTRQRQPGEDVIMFWLSPNYQLKPGEAIPENKSLYTKLTVTHAAVQRTINEATRLGADTAAARDLLKRAHDEWNRAVIATRTSLSTVTKTTTTQQRPYTRNYYAETSPGGSTLRGKTPTFTGSEGQAVAHLRALFNTPSLSGASLVRRSSSSSANSYISVPGGGIFTPNEAVIWEGLPNKGLKNAYFKRKYRERRGH